jgi:hypothetical protein
MVDSGGRNKVVPSSSFFHDRIIFHLFLLSCWSFIRGDSYNFILPFTLFFLLPLGMFALLGGIETELEGS